ncbi:MAG: hypothetical protein ABI894_06880 [Ilumatobacteraceae bacterium]
MFDIDEFIADCQTVRSETDTPGAIKEVLERALAGCDDVAQALCPSEGGITVLYQSADLTILNVAWAPSMRIQAHDHRMWAAIGIYTGQEDNSFYRRSAPGSNRLTASGGKTLTAGDVAVLGDKVVHSVANPLDRLTAAIHIYGGDFVNQTRSQWASASAEEQPFDLHEARSEFADANRAWRKRAVVSTQARLPE